LSKNELNILFRQVQHLCGVTGSQHVLYLTYAVRIRVKEALVTTLDEVAEEPQVSLMSMAMVKVISQPNPKQEERASLETTVFKEVMTV